MVGLRSELSKKYEVHPNQIAKWKNQLKEHCTSVFKERGDDGDVDKDRLIAELYKTVGSLTMDVEFLKKVVAMTKDVCRRMVSKEERLYQSLGYKTPASRYITQKEAA